MALTLDEVIEALTTARNDVSGDLGVEVWIDEGATEGTTIRDIISDVNGVSIILDVE